MLSMMEKYTYNLEGLVQERTDQLVEEKKKTEALLHRVLPKSVYHLHIHILNSFSKQKFLYLYYKIQNTCVRLSSHQLLPKY